MLLDKSDTNELTQDERSEGMLLGEDAQKSVCITRKCCESEKRPDELVVCQRPLPSLSSVL